ncbi:maltose ABC transporter substrate-binding protein [Occultella aeris]|uniref:Cyclodextrin-binding protein n=1 Tax=Occultella aeris TaxID=2761496 RepID=A0A7M4DQF8_9MICO|nr:maltose ABC transporter substrate-binding protein [Occultella aeris]VZO39702.1 Cyclodextrin-binding protein precursor [Occultella aeris]
MRRSIVITAAVGLTMALAACGGGTGSGEDETTAGAEETTEDGGSAGTLTIWADEFRAAALTDIVAQFEEDKGVTVEIVEKNFDDIKDEFIAQAPTGEGPDIIVGAHDWSGELVTNGLVSPVELGDAAADFSEVAVNAFTYEGSVYGVPYGIENIALVRNNALASDTPATFDELIAQGEASGAEYPVLIQMGEEGDAFHMYPLQTSFGAPVFATDDTGSYIPELALGGDAGTAFADYLASIGQAGSGVLDTAITADIAREAFANGESPYILTGPWNIAPFTDAGIDVTVLPIPSAGGEPAAPFVGVQGFYVNSYSENAILANEFLINYAATEDVQVAMYETGGRIPALTAAAEAVSDDPIAAGFVAAGEIGVPMPSLPQMNSVWAFWGVTEANLVSGVATDPAAAWATMVENIQGAIDAA